MTRQQRARRSFERLGVERCLSFLRAALDEGGTRAVDFINRDLDEGKSLDGLPFGDDDSGYSLDARRLGPLRFRITFGCSSGPLLGEGGEWEVVFDGTGKVASCRLELLSKS